MSHAVDIRLPPPVLMTPAAAYVKAKSKVLSRRARFDISIRIQGSPRSAPGLASEHV